MALTEKQEMFCLEFLKAGIRVVPRRGARPFKEAIFKGQAKNYQRYNDSSFQTIAREHEITPGTMIAVWQVDDDAFSVMKT